MNSIFSICLRLVKTLRGKYPVQLVPGPQLSGRAPSRIGAYAGISGEERNAIQLIRLRSGLRLRLHSGFNNAR
jgi:hypothetical protein